MQSYSPRIVSSALSDPFRVINEMGGDPYRYCRLADIDGERADDTIGLAAYVRFFEIASQQLNDPEFGWEVGARFDLRNIGEVGQSMFKAPTLGAALTLFRRAFSIVQSDSELELRIDGDEAVLSYRILDLDIWPRQQDVELTLSIFHALLKAVAGRDWRPSRIAMEHEPSAICRNASIGPKCRVEYRAAENSLRFPIRLLDLPLDGLKTGQFPMLTQMLSNEAWRRERDAPVTVRVRREIVRRLGRGGLDQTEIAEVLGYSRRTLRRRLGAEGQSFSDLLSECRMQSAIRMLGAPDTPMSRVAEFLGYTEISAFERAFRSWTGQTPARFKKLRNRSYDPQLSLIGDSATCSLPMASRTETTTL